MQDSPDVPTSTPLDGWLAELGQAQGAPGGGAASGVMLGIAASLLRMVAEYTHDEPRAVDCSGRLAEIRAEALAGVETDGIASAQFGAALARPTDDPARDGSVGDAAVAAAESSARLGAVGIRLISEVRLLDEIGNASLGADLAVATEALRAGIAGALITVQSNRTVARKHGADAAALRSIAEAAARLTEARHEAAQIADRLAGQIAD